MKKILILMIFASIGVICYAQDLTIYSSWQLEKITKGDNIYDYSKDQRRILMTIEPGKLSVNGSCTPCSVKEISINDNTLRYISQIYCETGCCFFDNEKDEIMKIPRIEGEFRIKDNALYISKENVTFKFSKK